MGGCKDVRAARSPKNLGAGVPLFSAWRPQPTGCRAHAPSAHQDPDVQCAGRRGPWSVHHAALQGVALHALATAAAEQPFPARRRRESGHAPGGRSAQEATAPGRIVVTATAPSRPPSPEATQHRPHLRRDRTPLRSQTPPGVGVVTVSERRRVGGKGPV